MKTQVNSMLRGIIKKRVWCFSLILCLLSGVGVYASEEDSSSGADSAVSDGMGDALKDAMEKAAEAAGMVAGVKNAGSGVNDGTVRSDPASEILGVPLGIEGVQFFDFYVPYNLSIKDTGGYASSVSGPESNSYVSWFKGAYDETKLGSYYFGSGVNEDSGYWSGAMFNIFGSKPEQSTTTFKDCTMSRDESTGLMCAEVTDKNGKTMKVYMAAIGKCFFDNTAFRQKFKCINIGVDGGYHIGNRGMLYDVILADGTQIHFAIASAFGANHMLGGSASTGQDGVSFYLEKLKYNQYVGITHCAPPYQMFELCASETSTTDVKKALGINRNNPVVAVRVYDTKVNLKDFTIVDGFEEAITKSTAPGMSSGRTAMDSPNALKGYYDEMDLAAWSYLNGETVIDFKDRSDLNQSDLNALHDWESNVASNKFSITKVIRYCVSFIGILFIVWGMFMYLAYWFDRVNTILPISLVSFLSLGMFTISPDESECTFKITDVEKGKVKTVNHIAIIEICLLAIGFGTLLVTGYMYMFISWIIRLVFSWLS